ncbi:hypothetical protein KCU95_g114, partial [Aureobasidium melanogenum]
MGQYTTPLTSAKAITRLAGYKFMKVPDKVIQQYGSCPQEDRHSVYDVDLKDTHAYKSSQILAKIRLDNGQVIFFRLPEKHRIGSGQATSLGLKAPPRECEDANQTQMHPKSSISAAEDRIHARPIVQIEHLITSLRDCNLSQASLDVNRCRRPIKGSEIVIDDYIDVSQTADLIFELCNSFPAVLHDLNRLIKTSL